VSHFPAVNPKAEAEIVAARDWYDDQSPGLGADFVRAVAEALTLIQQNPYQYLVVHGEFRRVGLRRFQYALIYVVIEDEVVVIACMHHSRDPRRWQSRLR
jgi:plasmid stabilization system protein ParE